MWSRGDLDPEASAEDQLSPQPNPDPSRSPTHRILTALGTTPPGLYQVLSSFHENSHIVDPKTPELISKIVYNASLALFRKDEAFRKWKRKFL